MSNSGDSETGYIAQAVHNLTDYSSDVGQAQVDNMAFVHKFAARNKTHFDLDKHGQLSAPRPDKNFCDFRSRACQAAQKQSLHLNLGLSLIHI